jgi:acyl-homoserine lactone acylase PvdQ
MAEVLSVVLATHGNGPPVYGVLFAGIFIAVIGMGAYLRWTAHKEEKNEKQP